MLLRITELYKFKTLCLHWGPTMNVFKFHINFVANKIITKQYAFAKVPKIFDPLGWLSPITFVAMLFLQKLWLMQST